MYLLYWYSENISGRIRYTIIAIILTIDFITIITVVHIIFLVYWVAAPRTGDISSFLPGRAAVITILFSNWYCIFLPFRRIITANTINFCSALLNSGLFCAYMQLWFQAHPILVVAAGIIITKYKLHSDFLPCYNTHEIIPICSVSCSRRPERFLF